MFSSLLRAIRSDVFEQMMLLEGLDEFADIVFSDSLAHFEFLADFIDDGQFGGPAFKKFDDSRSNEVEVEHLALPDIQHNSPILPMCAADGF